MSYIFFGAGKIGRHLGKVMGHEVAFYCDNNTSASEVEGIPVIDFEALREIYVKYTVVVTVSGKFQTEIETQLRAANIPYILYPELFTIGRNPASRNAWVEKILKSLPSGIRILDAGAGEQQYRKFCSHLQYVSQDFCAYDGTGNGEGLQTNTWDTTSIDIVSDITDIPEKDESFDAILCTEVFEHILSPEAAIREFSRLCRGGGHLILTAPFCSYTHFAPYHYATGLSRYWYETILPKYGFEIQTIEADGNFCEFLAQAIWAFSKSYANIYSSYSISEEEMIDIEKVLHIVSRVNEVDKNSEELCCFGWFVFAERVRE